jgi:hypothetical protein
MRGALLDAHVTRMALACAVPVYKSFGFARTLPTQSSDGVLFNPMALESHG